MQRRRRVSTPPAWIGFLGVAIFATFGAATAVAQSSQAPPDSSELAQRLDALAREVADLKLGAAAGPLESHHGLGPAASKVYSVGSGVSLGGYGEVGVSAPVDQEEAAGGSTTEEDQGETKRTIDLIRQIVYVGYKFDERLLFNSEIEFEHASTEHHGSVSVEFGYLDALLRPEVNVRAGLMLVPMGFINELHEPPVYLGVRRPETEQFLIPSTWRANGIGVFGAAQSGLSYRAYAIESFRSFGGTGENAGFGAEGLRDGRQNGSEALFEDVAGVLRADYQRHGVSVGGSVFYGNTAQGGETPAGTHFDAATAIWEGHAELRRSSVRLRALWAGAHVDDAEKIDAARGLTGDASVGSSLMGYYLEGGYELWSRLHPESRYEFIPYVRYEQLDTQREVPSGFARDPEMERTFVTAGAAFYPHPQVVVKGDYQWNSNEADNGIDRWQASVGFLF